MGNRYDLNVSLGSFSSKEKAEEVKADLSNFFKTRWQSLSVYMDVEQVYATRIDCIRCP